MNIKKMIQDENKTRKGLLIMNDGNFKLEVIEKVRDYLCIFECYLVREDFYNSHICNVVMDVNDKIILFKENKLEHEIRIAAMRKLSNMLYDNIKIKFEEKPIIEYANFESWWKEKNKTVNLDDFKPLFLDAFKSGQKSVKEGNE